MRRRKASTSNLAVLNALNRQLKRNYLRGKSGAHNKDSTSTRPISPLSTEGLHHDGRVTEYVENYIPWPLEHHEPAQPHKFQYTPIPHSAVVYDPNFYKSQHRLDDEKTAQKIAEQGSRPADAAGVKYYQAGAGVPPFYAWNPQNVRSQHMPTYETEGASTLLSELFAQLI
jgi:hypothetical protein